MSILTLITVPIGNIEDITNRARKQIENSAFILAEDSRVLRKLLNHLDISSSSKKIISYHDHSDEKKLQQIINIMDNGEDIALVSDAGSPIISDPAYPLIQAVLEGGHELTTCPGVSSVITALELSGLPANTFSFHGFFPRESDKQKLLIEKIKTVGGTYILFESPHRIKQTVKQLAENLEEASFAVCRELTKMYESVYRFKAKEYERTLEELVTKGEFVLIIYSPVSRVGSISSDKVRKLAEKVLESKGSNKSLSKLLGELLGESAKNIYSKLL